MAFERLHLGMVKQFDHGIGWSDKSDDEDEGTASYLEIGKCMFGIEFGVRDGMENQVEYLSN